MRRFCTLASALALGLSIAAPVAAAEPAYVFDPGVACTFGLGIDGGALGPRNYREFTDDEGNVLWTLLAGRGGSTTFTNMETGATLSMPATGSVARVANHPDGSGTMYLTGGWVLIMFPTDVPPGPSTTVYIGRVVADFAADGVTTLQSVSGTATDVCAALS